MSSPRPTLSAGLPRQRAGAHDRRITRTVRRRSRRPSRPHPPRHRCALRKTELCHLPRPTMTPTRFRFRLPGIFARRQYFRCLQRKYSDQEPARCISKLVVPVGLRSPAHRYSTHHPPGAQPSRSVIRVRLRIGWVVHVLLSPAISASSFSASAMARSALTVPGFFPDACVIPSSVPGHVG